MALLDHSSVQGARLLELATTMRPERVLVETALGEFCLSGRIAHVSRYQAYLSFSDEWLRLSRMPSTLHFVPAVERFSCEAK